MSGRGVRVRRAVGRLRQAGGDGTRCAPPPPPPPTPSPFPALHIAQPPQLLYDAKYGKRSGDGKMTREQYQ